MKKSIVKDIYFKDEDYLYDNYTIKDLKDFIKNTYYIKVNTSGNKIQTILSLKNYVKDERHKQEYAFMLVNNICKELLKECKNSMEFKEKLAQIDDGLLKDCYCLYGEEYDREKMINLTMDSELYTRELIDLDDYYYGQECIINVGEYVCNHHNWIRFCDKGFQNLSNDIQRTKDCMVNILKNGYLEKDNEYNPFDVYKVVKPFKIKLLGNTHEGDLGIQRKDGDYYNMDWSMNITVE